MKALAFALPLICTAVGFSQPWPEVPNYDLMKIPANNPMTAPKVELGKQLYYDVGGGRAAVLA